MSSIIAIASQKGGTGKTATALNLGAALVKKGESVLLVDMDSQANCSKGLGIKLRQEDMSIRDLLMDPLNTTGLVRQTAIDHLDIIPSNIYLSAIEMELSTAIGGFRRLASGIAPLREEYDHIIIDAPPSLGILAINALVACKYVIIPMEAEPYALDGMDAFRDTLEKVNIHLGHKTELLGVLITKFRMRTTLHTQILEEVRRFYGSAVFDTVIHINIDVAAANIEQIPVIYSKPTSTAALDYQALADEVLKREEQKGRAHVKEDSGSYHSVKS